MIILIFLAILIGVYVAYFALSLKRKERLTKDIPSVPSSFPIIGHALMFVGNTHKILKNIEKIAYMAINNSKGICKIWLGPRMYVAIGNPEDAQVVLENCLDKDGVYRFLRPWLGNGLFVAPLTLWKCHRKVLLPVFHNKVVEQYLGVISEQADVLVQKLADKTEEESFDVLKYITACTLDIVFETAMGKKMDVQNSPDTPYLLARNTVMTILNMRFFKVWLQPDCIFNLTSYEKQQRQNIALTHKFTDDVVKTKRIEYETNKEDLISTPKFTPGKLRAVLDLLFGREIEFTDEQLREHIDSITIAGNDTTALVIAYTLVLLGIHQDSQERIFEEQKLIFGNSLRGPTKEDLQKMMYLERVIKESMRMYTVVPIIARNVDKDTYLPYSGVTIPAGSGAVVGSFAIHRSEMVWGPNANEYDPDRFLPERSLTRHAASFLPFSFGSRNCIGRNFGMFIMKSILSRFVRSYTIKANDIGKLKIEMLLFPIDGHLIKIEKRNVDKAQL